MDGKPFRGSPRNEEIQLLLNYLNALNAKGELSAFAFGVIFHSLDTRIGHHMADNMSLLMTGALEKLKKDVMDSSSQRQVNLMGGPDAG